MPNQDAHRSPEDILDRAIQALRDTMAVEEPPHDSEARILASLQQASIELPPETTKRSSTSMNRIAKIAAAVVIVVGLGGILTWLVPGSRKTGIVFADVVRYFINASTAKYVVVVELEGHKPISIKRKQDFKDRRWPWDNSGPMGIQMMPRDWGKSGKACDPLSEDFEGETLYFFGQADNEGIQDFFELMGQMYAQAKAELGSQVIDGQSAMGFRLEQDGTVYSIWASAETGLPLRIDITNSRLLGKGRVTLKDFEFDVVIPTAMMGGGYVFDRGWKWVSSEDELIKSLRRRAENHDGEFPPYLVHQAWFFKTPEYFRNPDLDLKTKQQIFMLHSQVIIRGLLFASQLPAGNHWRYLGRGMTFDPDDSKTPICWYRPEGHQNYRMIYRDLSIRDVAPDALPTTRVSD